MIDKFRKACIIKGFLTNYMEGSYLIDGVAKGKERLLIDRYIIDGPSSLRRGLKLNKVAWRLIFDYLVFKHDLVMRTIKYSSDFFLDCFVKHGSEHIRDILDIKAEKYDEIWGGILFYLLKNSRDYRLIEGEDGEVGVC